MPLKAIIILNPNAKGLSLEAQKNVADLRDRIQDMLFQVVKELHPSYNASSRFGNLLLLLPTITVRTCENLMTSSHVQTLDTLCCDARKHATLSGLRFTVSNRASSQ